MIVRLILTAICFLGLSCGSLPQTTETNCSRIPVPAGPEDFVVDNKFGRLLVSSHDRRNWQSTGKITSVSLQDGKVTVMEREGEPEVLSFRPHGMDLLKNGNNGDFLYVILHGPEQDDDIHAVAVYKVLYDRLIFVQQYQHKLLNSPNDIAVLPDGSFYVTNDAGKRGSSWEMLWGMRKSNIVYYSSKTGFRIAATNLAMANGIIHYENQIFATATRDDELLRFVRQPDGSLVERKVISKFAMPDNIMAAGNRLLVTSHPSARKFMRHRKKSANKAPSVVYLVNPVSGGIKAIFADEGKRISAVSTAALVGNQLYLGQVFDDFLLSCDVAGSL